MEFDELGPASPRSPMKHRRARSIVVGCLTEQIQLEKENEVYSLHSELERQNKALLESQQEAKLAAEIGQSLLRQTQKLGKDRQDNQNELVEKLSGVEKNAGNLKFKLEEAMRMKDSALCELEKTNEALEDLTVKHDAMMAIQNTMNTQLGQMKKEKIKAEASAHQANEMLDSLEEDRVNQKQKFLDLEVVCSEWKQKALKLQQICDEKDQTLSIMEERLLSEQLHQTKHNGDEKANWDYRMKTTMRIEELESNYETKLHEADGHLQEIELMTKENQSLHVRLGEAKVEIQALKEQNQNLVMSNFALDDDCSNQSDLPAYRLDMDDSIVSPGRTSKFKNTIKSPELKSPNSPFSPTKRASLFDEIVETFDDLSAKSPQYTKKLTTTSCQTTDAALFTPSLSNQTPLPINQHDTPASDLNHEFFMLTSTALKLNGAGLKNKLCNISNQELYQEALDNDITFDQYHNWLNSRLGGIPYHY